MRNIRWTNERHGRYFAASLAFTLVEILVVIAIIGVLVGLMGAVVRNSVRKAREAATVATIQKIDGLLEERLKGFERATKSRDFQRYVEFVTNDLLRQSEDINRNGTLDAGEDLNGNGTIDLGVLRLSPRTIEAVSRKRFLRDYFPQRFEELADVFTPPSTNAPNGIPDILDRDVQITFNPVLHRRRTESSELLYYALTKMSVFGVPPVGESEFGTSEVADTDGDGLLEFVDAWGRPLRFYRWPTRLLKPNGPYGIDGIPFGNSFGTEIDSNGNGTLDPFEDINGNGVLDAGYYGRLDSDDVVIPRNIRELAGLLIDGLISGPVIPGQWDELSVDPDDPYGIITTELQRQFASRIHAYPAYPIGTPTSTARFEEPLYPTLDTYHTPLIVSVGPDGVRPGFQDDGANSEVEDGLGLFEPWEGADSNGDGIPDSNMGMLAQPRGLTISGGQYVIPTALINALTDNITNRNRRAGRGK